MVENQMLNGTKMVSLYVPLNLLIDIDTNRGNLSRNKYILNSVKQYIYNNEIKSEKTA